jgi:hypothetical protein
MQKKRAHPNPLFGIIPAIFRPKELTSRLFILEFTTAGAVKNQILANRRYLRISNIAQWRTLSVQIFRAILGK